MEACPSGPIVSTQLTDRQRGKKTVWLAAPMDSSPPMMVVNRGPRLCVTPPSPDPAQVHISARLLLVVSRCRIIATDDKRLAGLFVRKASCLGERKNEGYRATLAFPASEGNRRLGLGMKRSRVILYISWRLLRN